MLEETYLSPKELEILEKIDQIELIENYDQITYYKRFIEISKTGNYE